MKGSVVKRVSVPTRSGINVIPELGADVLSTFEITMDDEACMNPFNSTHKLTTISVVCKASHLVEHVSRPS